MNQNKARVIVLAVFIIGFTAGALAMNLYSRLRSDSSDRANQRPTTEQIVGKMGDRLSLSAEQREKIKAILIDTQKQYREIRQSMEPMMKEFEPRFEAVRNAGRNRIREEVLTKEQVPEYEKMVAEREAERARSREKHKE